MTDRNYLDRIEAAFQWAESQAEAWSQDVRLGVDVESTRQGGSVLNLEFPGRQVLVINAQAPLQQLWLASRLGAQHFVDVAEGPNTPAGAAGWQDTRSGESFEAALLRHAEALLVGR